MGQNSRIPRHLDLRVSKTNLVVAGSIYRRLSDGRRGIAPHSHVRGSHLVRKETELGQIIFAHTEITREHVNRRTTVPFYMPRNSIGRDLDHRGNGVRLDLARGGFEVTSAREGGRVHFIEIASGRGETCRVLSPWSKPCVIEGIGGPSRTLSEELLHFETRADGRYLIYEIRRENHPHQRQRDTVDSAVEVENRKDEEKNLDGKYCRERSGGRDGDGQRCGLHFGDSKMKSLPKASVLVRPEKW